MRHDLRKCLCTIALVTGVAQGAPVDKANFAYTYPIGAPPGAQAYEIELPLDAYRWTKPERGLRDVEVFDARGEQVPAETFVQVHSRSHPAKLTLPLLAVPADSGGKNATRIERSTNGDIVIQPGTDAAPTAVTEWLIDAGQTVSVEQVTFPSTQVDEHADVRLDNIAIDVSEDLQSWQVLTSRSTIMSSGRPDQPSDVRMINVSGPAGRYYRVRVLRGNVRWATDGAATAVLSGSVANKVTADEPGRQWLQVAAAETRSDAQGVDYDYRLPAALPVDALRLTRGTDSVTRVEASTLVEGRPVEGLGTLVVTVGQSSAASTLTLPPARREVIRLHSATPLREAPHLSVGWSPDRLIFLASGEAPYRLMVGSYAVTRPAWPVADGLDALYKQHGVDWRPTAASVGAGERLGGDAALIGPKAPFDWTRPLLWGVLLLGAGLVAGMAASLLRKPKSGPPAGG
ncbi:MAG: DUF3999 family protein [Luteibacter sp.]